MRRSRLLRERHRGSAPVESVFAIVFLLFLVLAVLQLAFVLYARNVVAASVHEGARAAVELGRSPTEAVPVATESVRRSAGNLVDGLVIDVDTKQVGSRVLVVVRARGELESFGPIPLPVPVSVTATSTRETRVS